MCRDEPINDQGIDATGAASRTCGDRSTGFGSGSFGFEASPRARGSTCHVLLAGAGFLGFPACAGMYPLPLTPRSCPRRLPCTCGDVPVVLATYEGATKAHPHVRGYTLRTADVWRAGAGSCACAGMDPGFRSSRWRRARLPRMRGDRPDVTQYWPLVKEAPPHVRGWTQHRPQIDRIEAGSPAHAGMDPRSTPGPTGSTRLPRMCGDGPSVAIWVPKLLKAPPYARGCTSGRLAEERDRRGTPARAGMGPSRPARSRRPIWFPGTRGDVPVLVPAKVCVPEAPPHVQGWT